MLFFSCLIRITVVLVQLATQVLTFHQPLSSVVVTHQLSQLFYSLPQNHRPGLLQIVKSTRFRLGRISLRQQTI